MDMQLVTSCAWSAAFVFTGAYVGCQPQRPSTRPRPSAISSYELARRILALPLVREVLEWSRRAERRSVALRELPTLLDVVTLGLSSGLSFDASLELYCQRYDTSLAMAFSESMLSWRVGVTGRSEALDGLANQLDVAALRRFSAAVTQALAFGSPLAETLDQQAQAIRDEQRCELEAEIERVPVKMLIPLGTLIVPAMLLSILGPLLGSSVAFM